MGCGLNSDWVANEKSIYSGLFGALGFEPCGLWVVGPRKRQGSHNRQGQGAGTGSNERLARPERHPEYQGGTGFLQKLSGVGWSIIRTQEGRTGGAPQARVNSDRVLPAALAQIRAPTSPSSSQSRGMPDCRENSRTPPPSSQLAKALPLSSSS